MHAAIKFCFFLTGYFSWTAYSFTSPLSHEFLDTRTVCGENYVRNKICLFATGKKNLSAAEQERRDEENRRRMRQDDVVVGKTSAKKGEKDCALDPKATQQEFLKQASAVEQEVFQLTEAGMEYLKSVRT
jgi:hypothetical protein